MLFMDFETQLKLHKLWDAKETTPTLPAKSQPVAQDYQDPAAKDPGESLDDFAT